jgi:carbon monoxide dehydrogenase subunit G
MLPIGPTNRYLKKRWLVLCLAGATALGCALSPAVHAASGDDESPITVEVKKHGAQISIDADFTVAVTPQQAWQVLTDFDHMSGFVSNVTSSKVTGRHDKMVQVEQKGRAGHGPLSLDFESQREITLTPFETITSHQVSGTTKKLDAVTKLASDSHGTHITYHADSIPTTYVPPLIGPAFIESETRHQFEEMRTEMLKRKEAETK